MSDPLPPEQSQLQQAHDEMVALIATIPDDALDWQPGHDVWSLKETIAHVAHAYDFYIMILDEARAHHFTTVTMHNDLPGWQALHNTNAALKSCQTTPEILAAFQGSYDHALSHFHTITPQELDQLFIFDFLRPDDPPYTTTLRRRLLQKATAHLHEHLPQIRNTLSQWAKAHKA